MCGRLGLVARDAIEAPGERGDALGEEGLEATFGLPARDDSGAMPLPVFEGLKLRDDRSVRTETVLDGIDAGCRLSARGIWASLDHWYQIGALA